uniref:Myelin basic protein n=1 Tax=Panagrellus redivivus TaxID=6233 RepID=A0A7E4UZF6_PANRE
MEDYSSNYQPGPKEIQGPYRRFGSMTFNAHRSLGATHSPKATSKRTDHRGISGHMLKQPLLKFDVLWRKFGGNKRFEP